MHSPAGLSGVNDLITTGGEVKQKSISSMLSWCVEVALEVLGNSRTWSKSRGVFGLRVVKVFA